jgi:tRNA-Thr(GGU) m(6)t(6)A37 methyltransferase TsaA
VGGGDIDETQAIVLHPIGYVEREERDVGLPHEEVRARPARIVLDPLLAEGLLGLQPGSDVVVLYWLHRATGYRLQLHPRDDLSQPLRGVFATRTQYRPNPIAVTTVRIRRVEGNVLEVIGLDALDGSPVLDIKSHTSEFDGPYIV